MASLIKSVPEAMNVLIVGGGITGSALIALLNERITKNYECHLWEAATQLNQSGGRLRTHSGPAYKDNHSSVDLGAQYLTLLPEYRKKYDRFYSDMLKRGVLSPLSGYIEGEHRSTASDTGTNYMAPEGTNTLVQYFRKHAGVQINYGHHVKQIDVVSKSSSPRCHEFRVHTHEGVSDLFDVVALTMPVPEILKLQGNIQNILDGIPVTKSKLSNVTYSSRFALALFYPPGYTMQHAWCCRYITGHPSIRFIAIDNEKRNVQQRDDVIMSVVLHTSVQYGAENLDRGIEEVKTDLLNQFQELYPDLPEPEHVYCHKWYYSQVQNPYDGRLGYVTLSESPLLICGGDGFTCSKIDHCLDSAQRMAENIYAYCQDNPVT